MSETPLTVLIQYLRPYTNYVTESSTCHNKSYVNRLLRQQATVHTHTHAHETQPHVRTTISIYLWLYSPLWDLGCFFSFLFIYAVGRTPGMGISPSQGSYLHTEQHKQYKIHTIETSMNLVGFKPIIPAFERAKTIHAFDRAAAVISHTTIHKEIIQIQITRFTYNI
jgi:hypothetical protein